MSIQLDDVLRHGNDVATVGQLTSVGLNREFIANRVRTGRWQRPLPRVIVAHSGPLTADQHRRAALLYCGPDAVLSHESAATLLGLRVEERLVHVTVPHGAPRRSVGFVAVHQSRARPAIRLMGGLPCTGIARAVVDVACGLRALDDVRALVTDAVQRGLTTINAIRAEADRAPRHSPAHLRLALEETTAGARSVGEAHFLRLVKSAGLPMPELNVRIDVGGRHLNADALWQEWMVIVEIDGKGHMKESQWEYDLQRQNILHTAGYIVLRFTIRRMRLDPERVTSELRTVLNVRGYNAA